MQLVSMDICRDGSHETCHLGPFSPGLNAVCGPKGSGKTVLLGWLRELANASGLSGYAPYRETSGYAPGLASRVTGTAEVANRGVRYRWTNDRNGTIRHELTSSEHYSPLTSHTTQSHLTPVQQDVFSGLAAAYHAVEPEKALLEIAQRLQLTSPTRSVYDGERERLSLRESEIVHKITSLAQLSEPREELLKRREQLETELAQTRESLLQFTTRGQLTRDHRRLSDRYELLEADLVAATNELQNIDRDIATVRSELKSLEIGNTTLDIGETYRTQLQKLDDRLNAWRETLRDIKKHRDTIENSATDARLDQQIGEQISLTKNIDPRGALRTLEAHIRSASERLEAIIGRYGDLGRLSNQSHSNVEVRRDRYGRTHLTAAEQRDYLPETSDLPETLRSMQAELHEVCHLLARQEASTSSESLKQQSQQLERCEVELLRAVERLIGDRAALLRRIADEHHVSVEQVNLAFGKWCQCHDHQSLNDWLREDTRPTTSRAVDASDRQRFADELAKLERERKSVALRVEDCRSQIRDAELVRRGHADVHVNRPIGRPEHEILAELAQVNRLLLDTDSLASMRAELESIRRSLATMPTETVSRDRFQTEVDCHIVGLMGDLAVRDKRVIGNGTLHHTPSILRRYDTVNGVVVEQPAYSSWEADVPTAIVGLAMRLTIAEAAAARGEPIALVIDEALDNLHPDIQLSAVNYLASRTTRGQQIVLLTGDERVASLVGTRNGYVCYMNYRPVQQASLDVNRQLLAFANDLENEKWGQPVVDRESTRWRDGTFLVESSRIEELPSIDLTAAKRFHHLGIDRIGDLLDCDPNWTAENMRLNGLTASTIARWQAEAKLLCTVRQLRPFDARVLVGAGIRSSKQLSEMHPSELLAMVERFLATDRGRSTLQSGNNYELSRITSWIAAAAKGSSQRPARPIHDDDYEYGYGTNGYASRMRNGRSVDYADSYEGLSRNGYSADSFDGDRDLNQGRSSNRPLRNRNFGDRQSRPERRRDNDPKYAARANRPTQPISPDRDSELKSAPSDRSRSSDREARRNRGEHVDSFRVVEATSNVSSSGNMRFYLELSSPVVDAPSIGPRMAERLESLGIHTVAQFLNANAEKLAQDLNNRKISGKQILQWQDQSRLVCRIPNLRGHDAQLLVSCDLTSPEELSSMSPTTVLAQVLEIANSGEGQRILRGSKAPDLEEVQDWIAWASQSRSLHAA